MGESLKIKPASDLVRDARDEALHRGERDPEVSREVHDVRAAFQPAGFAGHAKREAEEIVGSLSDARPGSIVLVPRPETAVKFGPLRLEDRHTYGFRVESSPQMHAPGGELLLQLQKLDRRSVFIPEVFSKTLHRNVRFAVILPPHFDGTSPKAYPVVGMLPELPGKSWSSPTPATLGEQLLRKGLMRDVDSLLAQRGTPNAIVVVPERLEHRPGIVPDGVLARQATDLLHETLIPYVAEHFNGQPRADAIFRSGGVSETLQPREAWGPAAESERKSFGSSLKSWLGIGDTFKKSGADEAPKKSSPEPERPSFWVKPSWGDFPSEGQLEGIKKRDVPAGFKTTVRPKGGESADVRVILPKGYDPAREAPYRVTVGVLPEKASVDAEKIAAEPPESQDILVLRSASSPVSDLAILQHLAGGLNVDGSGYRTVELGSGATSDVRKLGTEPGQDHSLNGPLVFNKGQWRRLVPSRDHERAFPAPSKEAAASEIPRALQKQPADHGSFFVPTLDSQALKRRTNFGVYLPPGYDPASPEKYPVLLLLPGRGNPLQHWTAAGDLVSVLDQMMAGDAQKMIVVVPDNTDSFWFDYDKNGHPSVGEKGARNYEGLVMDELLGYATNKLHGDAGPGRVSVAGISRGGFGAISLAARHPGKFASASAHSGVLALEHDSEALASGPTTSVKDHFGPPGDPVWSQMNPKDLVDAGRFDHDPPKLYVDVGDDDPILRRDTLAISDALEKRGVPHIMAVLHKQSGKLVHNWDTWGPMLPTIVGFHQAAFGKPGKAKIPTGVVNVGREALADYRSTEEARRRKVDDAAGSLRQRAGQISDEARRIGELARNATPFELALVPELREDWGRLQEGASRLSSDASELQSRVARGKPLVGAEGELPRLSDRAQDLERLVNRAKGWDFGTRPERPVADKGSLEKLSAGDRADLKAVMAKVPGAEAKLALLATARPEVFRDVDPLTGARFADRLKDFVERSLTEKEVPGFLEFLDRVAVRRFDWRRGGYSHVVCTAMNTVYNHPGLVLGLIQAARDGNPYKVRGVYPDDGARELRPIGDLKAGFQPVEWADELPPAQLGYERGLLRAIRDELAPNPASLPRERFAKLCDPVAVGLSKLVGQDVHYGYAWNLRTGQDLVDALATQNGEGLTFGDVEVEIPGAGRRALHFPVFYDYDPKTRTVAMQEWTHGERRISIDGLRFADYGEKRPAIFYRSSPGLEPFLTPDKQPNAKPKPSSSGSSSGSSKKKKDDDWFL